MLLVRAAGRGGSGMEERQFIVGVDLDGVCADFYGTMREMAAEWLGKPVDSLTREVSYGLAEWELDRLGGYERLHRWAVTQRNLFRELRPIPEAPQVLRRLSMEGIRIRIITHRLFIKHFHQVAIQQTIEWLDRYDIPYWDLCFMRDKGAVGAHVYIDDAPENILRLREAGSVAIVFSNSTNRDLADPRADSWREIEAQVLGEYARWKARP